MTSQHLQVLREGGRRRIKGKFLGTHNTDCPKPLILYKGQNSFSWEVSKLHPSKMSVESSDWVPAPFAFSYQEQGPRDDIDFVVDKIRSFDLLASSKFCFVSLCLTQRDGDNALMGVISLWLHENKGTEIKRHQFQTGQKSSQKVTCTGLRDRRAWGWSFGIFQLDRKWFGRRESPWWETKRKRAQQILLSDSSVISKFPIPGAAWQLENQGIIQDGKAPQDPQVLLFSQHSQAQQGHKFWPSARKAMNTSCPGDSDVKIMKINK